MNLTGKHVVIAGGSSGIGFAIAKLAEDRGATVTLIGRSAAKLADAKSRLNGKTRVESFDLADSAAAPAAFERIEPFDYFVSTVADLTYGPLETMETAAISRMLAGKFWGPINFVQNGLKKILPGGSVLLFSGLAATRPGAGTVVVSALNAGVEGLVRALAVELAPVRVNGVSPGVVETEGWSFMDAGSRRAFFTDLGAKLPVKRVGAPADIADAALFALTNPYMTGEILHVDGGGALI